MTNTKMNIHLHVFNRLALKSFLTGGCMSSVVVYLVGCSGLLGQRQKGPIDKIAYVSL